MKTWYFTLTAIIAIFCIIGFNGCDNGSDTDNPKDQSKTITFGDGFATVVTGHMTNADWNIVIPKLTTALNAGSVGDPGDSATLAYICTVYFADYLPFGIVLENSPTYSYYQIKRVENELRLNADFVISAAQNTVTEKVIVSIRGLRNDAPEEE